MNEMRTIGQAAACVVDTLESKMGEVVVREEAPPAPVGMTPMAMLQAAVERGAGIDVLERLMSLQERWEANEARKAFNTAIANAKAEIPVIRKNREVGYESKRSDSRTSYRHEDLAEIERTAGPILTRYGLSYRFRTESPIGGPITVTCIVSHRDGHSEENTLCAGRDDSGSKNSIQAVGSTITYLQRYTLKAALGLAASADDDAKSAEPADTITQEQADAIRDALEANNKDCGRFLKWAKIERIEDIRADLYQSCIDAIKAQPKQAAGA